MPTLSLTDFIDIVSKSGGPKATKIAQVKQRPDYEPAFDFYRPIREQIIEVHKNGQPKSALKDVLTTLQDRKKINVYPEIISAYLKWWGRKDINWFEPPRAVYEDQGVEIIINPEVGLIFNDEPHLVKLYFKAEPLTKVRIGIITFLMSERLNDIGKENLQMNLLDVRNAKIFTAGETEYNIPALLAGELAYISALWNKV
jgi:hypothetical protein